MYHPIIDRLKTIADLLPTAIGGEFVPSGTKQISITENGTITENVFSYADAEITVNVQTGGIVPTGTKQISITQNGTTTEDVTQYANAEITVNVPFGDGIEIIDYYDTGEIKELNWHGNTCPRGLYYCWYNTKPVTVNIIDAISIETSFFVSANVNPTISYLEKVTRVGSFGFNINTNATNDLSSVTLSLPNFETPADGFGNIESRFRVTNIYAYGGYYFPKNQRIAKYDFYQHKVPNATWQFGSVGYPVLQVGTQSFGSASGSGTITIYTTGELLDTIKNAVQNGAGSNYTWIYKASEATTYNGTAYAAGDTMLTV